MLSKGIIDYNGNYLYPTGEELKYTNIEEFLAYHLNNDRSVYKAKLDYYMAKPQILQQTDSQHNHLVVNYPKYLVDTLNGFFTGIPPTIKTENDKANDILQKWLIASDFTDELSEASKQASLYGKTYLLVYTNENSETRVTIVPPYSAFLIYDDSVNHTPLAFVQYQENSNGSITGTIYTQTQRTTFTSANGIEISRNDSLDEQPLLFNNVPAVEFYDNEERTGITDGVKTLIDSVNKTLSNKADDVDYFADAYLFLKGFSLDAEEQSSIKDTRLIQAITQSAGQDVDAKFLEKPNADTTQEHLIERETNLIFQLSMVANINDEVFGNATSGRSLEYKLLSMRNLTSNKERKFTKQLRKVFDLVSRSVDFGKGEKYNIGNDLSFQFIRNLPNNNSEEADTASKLSGIVSQETQLSTLSIVPDPKAEMKKIADEQADKVKNAVETQQKYVGSDSEQTNQQYTNNSDNNDEQNLQSQPKDDD